MTAAVVGKFLLTQNQIVYNPIIRIFSDRMPVL